MGIYGYKETRTISLEALRSTCVQNKWYTLGTNEDYYTLLKHAAGLENVTCDDLVEIASDIQENSETRHPVESIMYLVQRACVTTFEEI